MKKTAIILLGLSLYTSNIQARDASIEDRIVGLYVAFFNRASDSSGLEYWKNKAINNENLLDTLKELSSGFSSHHIFISTYEHLDNRAFVEAIYRNALGQDGDEEGIVNWVNHLNNGMSRSDMVANFVNSALTVDLTPENYPTLSQKELDLAKKRQNLIANKVTVSLEFTNRLKDKTNITNSQNPENDPAYLASIDIITDVTDSDTTVSDAVSFLKEIEFDDNPINRIRTKHNQGNKPPLANAGEDKTVTVNQSITLKGSGMDRDGIVIRYEWKKGDEVLGTTATITYTPTVVGIDELVLTVTDNDGLTATDTVKITVADSTAHQIPVLSEREKNAYLDAINEARSVKQDCHSKGIFPSVAPLSWSVKLYKAAYEHTNDLVRTDTFSHDGSGTENDWTGYKLGKISSMVDRVENYGYSWSRIGENIAAGTNTNTAKIVVQQWLNSDGHCANLMNSDFTEIGMAMMYNKNSKYGYYWTQNFGRPR